MNIQKYALFIMLLWSSFGLRAQCVVDAGPDLTVCYGDTVQIQASISGTVGSYNIRWEANELYLSSYWLTATTFLDDTTMLNPNIVPGPTDNGDWVTLRIIVEDSIGNICNDSMRFRNSIFGVSSISPVKFINQGDSTILWHYVYGGIGWLDGHYTYRWSPNYNIQDTTAVDVYVWPDTNMVYSCIYTDSVGCSISFSWWVYVLPTAVEKIADNTVKSWVYMQGGQAILRLESAQTTTVVNVYGAMGRTLLSKSFTGDTCVLEELNQSGTYFYAIVDEKNRTMSKGSFIIH